MKLIGPRVEIRDFEPTDAAAYLAYASLPTVTGPAGMTPVLTLARAAARVAQYRHAHSDFAITLDGQLIGHVGIYERIGADGGPAPATRELGYALHPDYWGRGYMHEALTLVLTALASQGVTTVWAGSFPDNHRSLAVLRHLGFTYAYTVPLPAGLTNNGPRQEAYYSLSLEK